MLKLRLSSSNISTKHELFKYPNTAHTSCIKLPLIRWQQIIENTFAYECSARIDYLSSDKFELTLNLVKFVHLRSDIASCLVDHNFNSWPGIMAIEYKGASRNEIRESDIST